MVACSRESSGGMPNTKSGYTKLHETAEPAARSSMAATAKGVELMLPHAPTGPSSAKAAASTRKPEPVAILSRREEDDALPTRYPMGNIRKR
eukprot:scaffold4357_cov113-Isochrysis_galbana.AAC.7